MMLVSREAGSLGTIFRQGNQHEIEKAYASEVGNAGAGCLFEQFAVVTGQAAGISLRNLNLVGGLAPVPDTSFVPG